MMWIVSFLIIILAKVDGKLLYEGSDCMFKNQRGTCISFDECKSVKLHVFSRAIGYSEVSHCASKDGISFICCPSIISDRAARSVKRSESSDQNTIGTPIDFQNLDGIPAEPGEFPHMAALGYNQINGLEWLCGGLLISEQYILTAAHCVTESNKPMVIRIGETSSLNDAKGGEAVCVSVDSITLHPHPQPEYRGIQSAFDMALIKLSKTVDSSFVRPACLHTATQELNSSQEVGATTKSNLKVTLLNIDSCNKTELSERNGGHFCALHLGKEALAMGIPKIRCK